MCKESIVDSINKPDFFEARKEMLAASTFAGISYCSTGGGGARAWGRFSGPFHSKHRGVSIKTPSHRLPSVLSII